MGGHPGDRLTAYVDGMLASEEAAEVAGHLAECAQCHGILEDLLAVRRLLRAVPEPESHPSLLPRTLARLEAGHWRRRARPGWVAVSAVLAAGGLAVALNLPFVRGLETSQNGAHFQQHAEAAMRHPLADITLAGYLSSALPYFALEEPPGGQDRP